MFFAKVSVLLHIMKLFMGNKKDSIYWAILALILVNMLFYTAIFFAFIFACVPRKKLWNPMLPGTCISTDNSIIATTAINDISDFSILLLPLFAIWKLQIPLKRKVLVGATFGTGLLCVHIMSYKLGTTANLQQCVYFKYYSAHLLFAPFPHNRCDLRNFSSRDVGVSCFSRPLQIEV